VRAQQLPTRVAVITALSGPNLTATVTAMQPDRFLPKPFAVAEMIAWLRDELARAGAARRVG
jgi:DNA-binding response OmpR family regulator